MNHHLIVQKSVSINANLTKVWEALTTPKIITKYLFGTETVTDWKVGNEIVFQGEYEGHQYKDHGIIIENIPLKKLSYSYWSGFSGLEDKPENYSNVTYTLMDKGDSTTELTWTQKGFADEVRRQHSEDGMADFLRSIKTVIEE
jgi:uncharacterized protein YndB with AHSA1/START domain